MLVLPPVPVKRTSADILYPAIFSAGLMGRVSKLIEGVLKSSDYSIKVRLLDSARENKRWTAHEMNIDDKSLFLLCWCSIHANHAITIGCVRSLAGLEG